MITLYQLRGHQRISSKNRGLAVKVSLFKAVTFRPFYSVRHSLAKCDSLDRGGEARVLANSSIFGSTSRGLSVGNVGDVGEFSCLLGMLRLSYGTIRLRKSGSQV